MCREDLLLPSIGIAVGTRLPASPFGSFSPYCRYALVLIAFTDVLAFCDMLAGSNLSENFALETLITICNTCNRLAPLSYWSLSMP